MQDHHRTALALVTNANAVGIVAQTRPAPGDVNRALTLAPVAAESIRETAVGRCLGCTRPMGVRCCEFGADA